MSDAISHFMCIILSVYSCFVKRTLQPPKRSYHLCFILSGCEATCPYVILSGGEATYPYVILSGGEAEVEGSPQPITHILTFFCTNVHPKYKDI